MSGELNGRVAIVTGAGQGIGRAAAVRLASEGAQVVAVDLTKDNVTALAGEVDGIVPMRLNVAEPQDIGRFFAEFGERFPALDILVNNAGVGGPRTLRLHELPLADFDAVMAVNLRGALVMTQHALPIMLAAGAGAIVNIASLAAFHATVNCGSYSLSKAGVAMLTKQIAKEYAADGIRANAIAPGVTRTAILEGLPKEHMDQIIASIPQVRTASPEEMAETILFLASDRSSYVNGAVLPVDGGVLA